MQESTKKIIMDAGFDFNIDEEIQVPEVEDITRNMKKAIINLKNPSRAELRTLVNLFYQIQEIRIGLAEQIRSINREVSSTGENSDVNTLILSWNLKQIAAIEKGINKCLTAICESDEVGNWLLGITGIGGVLAAGCLAYFDVTHVNYASNFISYAGLNDNNRPWLGRELSKKIVNDCIEQFSEDGTTLTTEVVEHISAETQWKFDYLREKAYNEKKDTWSKDDIIKACSKIPYNKSLKVHMWKIGKQFEYQKTRASSLYGKLLAERLAYEIKNNEAGKNAELCAKRLKEKNYGKDTKTYKAYIEGKLPDTEINARGRRWVQKIFISHLFDEMYRVKYNKVPPRYYVFEHGEGHHDFIEPEVPYHKVPGEK